MLFAGEFAHIESYLCDEVFHDLVTESWYLFQQLYRIVILGEDIAYLRSQLVYQDCCLVNIAALDTLHILKGNEFALT